MDRGAPITPRARAYPSEDGIGPVSTTEKGRNRARGEKISSQLILNFLTILLKFEFKFKLAES